MENEVSLFKGPFSGPFTGPCHEPDGSSSHPYVWHILILFLSTT